jgi:hypothetical protein
MMNGGRTNMATSTLSLEVERARAEAASRAVRAWDPPADLGTRARLLETYTRELLGTPTRFKALLKDVFDGMPKDGTIITYMDRHREALIACFRDTLDDLRTTADLARASARAAHPIPSLSELEKAIAEVEFLEDATLAHWTASDPNAKPDPDGGIPLEEAFRDLEEALSPEARRELQIGLERQRHSHGPDLGTSG